MSVLCRKPAGRGMAIATRESRLGSCRMRPRLSNGSDAIVAARTWLGRGVLVFGREPADKAVAGIACKGSLGDRGMATGLADSRVTVVAGRTGSRRYVDMVPAGRQPSG